MDFWSEYFAMRRGELPSSPAGVILQLTCLQEADRKWNPQFTKDEMRRRFDPTWKDSKRKLRLIRMYWAIKEGKVVTK